MSGCLEWFLIIGIVSVLIEYWYIVIPLLIIFLFILHKVQNKNSFTNPNTSDFIPQNYDHMNGHEFEQYCADILRKISFTNVYVTKGSGDFGIDILALKDGWKYAIQCKNYSSKVGNRAVQEAYSGKDYYNADIAVVITNNFFTPAAIETADRLNVELWDRDKLNIMISQSSAQSMRNTMSQKLEIQISEQDKLKLEEHMEKNLVPQELQGTESIPQTIVDKEAKVQKETEISIVYDEKQGIYPAGDYLVGEDIPLGKYLLKQREGSIGGEIHIYKDYQSYLKNPDNELIFKTFKGDYHLSLRTEGNLLVIENADMQKL